MTGLAPLSHDRSVPFSPRDEAQEPDLFDPRTPSPEAMAWLIQIANGVDWGLPLESEVAEPPGPA